MNNTAETGKNIIYLTYNTSGIANRNTDTTVAPTAFSNIIKGQTIITTQPPNI
jgi:hypothetical protein